MPLSMSLRPASSRSAPIRRWKRRRCHALTVLTYFYLAAVSTLIVTDRAAIDRSRNVGPRDARIRSGVSTTSPQTALPTVFTKPLAHTFASDATQQPAPLASRPSLTQSQW